MSDLLIRNIDPHLKGQLTERARANKRSLSEEARLLLKKAIERAASEPPLEINMFTAMRALIPEECRGDYDFEINDQPVRDPPTFE